MSSQSPRKRKNEDEEKLDEEPAAKSLRFSASEFRSKLKGPDPIDALKQFLKDDKEERIEEYIREGGSLSELLAMLNDFSVKKNVPKAIPVFQAITLFIIKCMSNFPEKHKGLVEECRQLLSIHLSLFHTMLTAVHSPRQKKVALKLLTAIISCDKDLAWDVLAYLKLTSQDVEALAFARKQSDPTSVREHFIRFLMSFLIDQPLPLVRKFISQKGLLISIFGGLKSDSFRDVLMVLTTLKSNIADVKEISKSLKLSVFNTASICNLIGVYSWDPRANASHPSHTELSLEGRDEVRRQLHELLLVLLTSVKMGVVFNDPSIGTTHKEFNELVTSVISGFGKPWGDEMREDLFGKMLSACPDVIKQAYRQIDSFLSEFNSARWIQGLKFFNKLIGNLNIEVSTLPVKARSTLVKTVFLPPHLVVKLLKSFSSEDTACRSAALLCLSTCLKRLHSYAQYCIPTVINNYLVSNLSCAELLIDNVEYFSSDGHLENDCSIKSLLAALDSLLYSYRICPQLLDSIRYKKKYYEMLREYVKRVKLRISSTTDAGNDEMEVDSTTNTDSEKLLLNKLAILKLIELLLIIWPLDSSQDDYEYWLEDLSECFSPNPEVVQGSLSIIRQILGSTGFFMGHCQKELDVWMYSLSNNLSFDSVKLIVQSIKYAGNNAKVIYSDLCNAEKIMTLEEDTSPLTLNLDDYIKACERGEETRKTSASGNVFSLSVPFVSMLKLVQDEQSFEKSDEFVVSLIIHLLHRQVNSEVLVALLKLYGKGRAASAVIDYAESWIRSSGSPLLLPPAFSNESIFSLASLYLLGESSQMPDLNGVKEDEFELLISQILFCSVHGCSTCSAASLVQSILTKCNAAVAATALIYQPLIDSFHPRKHLDSPSNSTRLVTVLIRSSTNLPNVLAPFQNRLAFELRYALRKTSALKACHSSIGEILNVVKLQENDIKYILENCCPLPKKLVQVSSDWRPIQEYLLRESVRLNIKLTLEALSEFLKQVLESIPNFSTIEDNKFLDTLCSYLEHNYSKTRWKEDMKHTFSDLLKAVLDCTVWSEKLAKFLYNLTPVDLCHLPLDRLSAMLEIAVHQITQSELYELLSSHKRDLISVLLKPDSTHWVDKLTSSLFLIHPGESDSNLKAICKGLMKHKSEIHLSISNLKLLQSLLTKAHMQVEMFTIAQDYLLQSGTLKDHSLGTCLADIMKHLLDDKECCLGDELIKVLLATGFKEPFPQLIQLLSSGVKLNRTALSPKEIFALLTSHSQFLNTMLAKRTHLKYEILVLLEALLKKDTGLMKSSHLPVFFSAYNATLSLHDQILVQILKMYEEKGIDLGVYKPYVWGETAAHRYSVSLKRKTLDDDSGYPTIQLLDLNVIQNTIKHFPTHRTLNGSEVKEIDHGNEIYDVGFLLGALSQVVGPDSTIYPSQIPCAGVTSLAFIAVGSQCPCLRAAGYHILHRHYTSLRQRKDDQIWSHLVEKLQRSICQMKNARLSGPLSVFLARASLIMSEPLHPLYHPMHNFILAKPVFSLTSFPAFLEFFHSSDPVNGRMLQSWILEVVRDGLRDQDDFQIVLSSFTSKLLLDFYCSKLASRKTQVSIEQILDKFIACDSKRHLLTKEYSLIPWLVFVKKYHQALDIVPSSHRYAPFKKFIKHCIDSSACVEKVEEKIMETD